MRNDQTATIFARTHVPITTFHALSLEPIPYVPAAISNLLPPGLTLLSGPVHCGKTSFALQLMYAVATGELPFGEDLRFQPSQGRVLYLGLQHSKLQLHTLQSRLAAAHCAGDARLYQHLGTSHARRGLARPRRLAHSLWRGVSLAGDR